MVARLAIVGAVVVVVSDKKLVVGRIRNHMLEQEDVGHKITQWLWLNTVYGYEVFASSRNVAVRGMTLCWRRRRRREEDEKSTMERKGKVGIPMVSVAGETSYWSVSDHELASPCQTT